MIINKLSIDNITVFDDIVLNTCDGLNILIGENGTGKTHILKFIYSICKVISKNYKDAPDIAVPYFKVDANKLIRNTEEKHTNVTVNLSDSNEVKLEIIKNGDMYLDIIDSKDYVEINPIFIPAKEMLSHSKGFLALNNKYDMPFDKTYVDIITNAELPETREVSQINKKILDIISKVIDGKVIYENDTFYIVKNNGSKVEFSLEAEGLRKLGLLYKLIRNGLIEKDTILLWDEPEANINPELIPTLVDILLELQREGVQIFIATHSYNLAKYFEIKRTDNDKVLFHNLYKTINGVKSQSNEYFGELDKNAIIKADSKLLDDVIEESLED